MKTIQNYLKKRILCLIENTEDSLFDEHYISFLEKMNLSRNM
jgi:hypothetical protein